MRRDTWTTELDDGSVMTSRYVIAATGLFSRPKLPAIPGLDDVSPERRCTRPDGTTSTTCGKRVAVIGTGATAVQVVPEIAPLVAQLSVFQRTPIWVGPRLDRPLSANSRRSLRRFAVIRSLDALRLRIESRVPDVLLIVNYRRLPFIVRLVQRTFRALDAAASQ